MQQIGLKKNRVDGVKKVTGNAYYSADQFLENCLYGYVVNSTIAKGKIGKINIQRAQNVEGVVDVLTHLNLEEKIDLNNDYSDPLAPPGEPFKPLHNEVVKFNHQPIALIVAETFEIARYASNLIEVEYFDIEESSTNLEDNLHLANDEDIDPKPPSRGDCESGFDNSDAVIEAEYAIPRHYHNPMEPHSSLAIWHDDEKSFTIYDKIQGVASSQDYICGIFDLKPEKVKVLSQFVGGAFGSGLRPQYQLFMAAVASKICNKPVKVVMTRTQMFSFGHRPASVQRLKLGASNDGQLKGVKHHSFCETSKFEGFSETISEWSGLMYKCENVDLDYKLVPLDNYTPLDMRAPGGVSGMYALETAMDELAVKLNMDPLQLRLINYAKYDQNEDKPFSSKALKECYEKASQAFGWDDRPLEPRSRIEGNQLIGYGMATGVWEAMQEPASAKAEINANGQLTVSSATADIGTGTYTVMSQIASDCMGHPVEDVTFKLGETGLPQAPIEGGSYTVSSVGSAVKQACESLKKSIFDYGQKHFPDKLGDCDLEDVKFKDGKIHNGPYTIDYKDIAAKTKTGSMSETVDCKPDDEREEHSCYAHSCVMVEVRVDKDLGTISVPRVVSAVAAGKIINPKTAESQLLGGITWGLSMALEEEGMMDDRYGRIINHNLAEYHVAIQADVQDLKVIFVDEEDDYVNPLGAKGIGEIGLVGVAAAVSNAVYNATGIRVRDLPITLDKLL